MARIGCGRFRLRQVIGYNNRLRLRQVAAHIGCGTKMLRQVAASCGRLRHNMVANCCNLNLPQPKCAAAPTNSRTLPQLGATGRNWPGIQGRPLVLAHNQSPPTPYKSKIFDAFARGSMTPPPRFGGRIVAESLAFWDL